MARASFLIFDLEVNNTENEKGNSIERPFGDGIPIPKDFINISCQLALKAVTSKQSQI